MIYNIVNGQYFLKRAEDLIGDGFSRNQALEKAYNDEMSLETSQDEESILEKEKTLMNLIDVEAA